MTDPAGDRRKEVNVRHAEAGDAKALHRTMTGLRVVEGTLQLPYQTVERYRKWLSELPESTYMLVAESGDEVVGNLGLEAMLTPSRRHVGRLYMAVRDDWQGKGVGTALVEAALDLAENWLNLTRIELEVYTDNQAGIALYEKFGFEIEGTLRRFAFRGGRYVDAYSMARIRDEQRHLPSAGGETTTAQTGEAGFDQLESERLILRRFKDSDLAPFLAYRNDPEVARYQAWESCTGREATAMIEGLKSLQPGTPGEWFQFAIELKGTGALIGDCALKVEQDGRQAEVGYTLAHEHQGKGYASEAISHLLYYAFGDLRLHRVVAITDQENEPSIALLERLGMRREGRFVQNVWFKGRWASEYLYAVLDEEWLRRKPRA